MAILVEEGEHLTALNFGNLLCVTAVSDWFVLVVWEANETKSTVGNILQENPLDTEHSTPAFALLPYGDALRHVNAAHHLCHATEMSTRIHTKE